MQESIEVVSQKIAEAELVLVGIGEKFDPEKYAADIRSAYKKLAGLLAGKNYFIVTVCTDELIYDAGFKEERIVRPLAEEEGEAEEAQQRYAHPSRWETYMKWLQGTLHKKLLVLELGVGLRYPDVIRFPFEKTVYLNRQSILIRIHDKLFQLPVQLKDRGISMSEDAVKLFADAEI